MPQAPEITTSEPVAALTDRYGGPEPAEVLARLQQPDMAGVKAVVCWRGVVVNGDVCLVDLALRYIRLVQEESCGRCGPCRIGVDVMREQLEKLAAGDVGDKGSEDLVGKIRYLAESIEDSAWCGIANTIRDPILAILDVGAEHFAAHAAGLVCEPVTAHGWVAAPCRSTCPSTVDCASYIFQALEEHPHLATTIVKRDNPLPAIIGRTCPHPCEANCTLAQTGQPIAINNIKRWCADRAEGLVDDRCVSGCLADPIAGAPPDVVEAAGGPALIAGGPHEVGELTTAQLSQRPVEVTCRLDEKQAACGRKVAIIGAGPAGLSAGYYLARRGYKAVIFEDLPVPGGMVHVGIPEYRLPRHVIYREAELIQQEGVEIRYNTRVGRDLTWEELESEFDATFVAVGAHLGRPLGIPGEDLPGAMDAIDFLRKVALHEPVDIGDDVLVLGGGNSAMDAARTAIRLGAKNVQVVYRRTKNEMPANPWEIEEAEEEGVVFHYLAAPVACKGEEGVSGLVCQQMELGEPDESGRRRPVPTDMAPFVLTASSIIYAVGQKPDFEPFKGDQQIELNKYGYMEVDPHTLMTTKPGVFVGGDAVSGGGTVIEAINAGKVAANYIDKYLRGEPVVEDIEDKTRRLAVYLGAQKSWEKPAETVDYGTRQKMPVRAVEERIDDFDAVELGYTLEQVTTEADRCLRCHRPILVVR
ncbi:MAG: FAD-dependent oxidoreductase [Actinomycetia bacterium]|nr:FAD-dependent oxidoreductase [Actinomycetes bacterium]